VSNGKLKNYLNETGRIVTYAIVIDLIAFLLVAVICWFIKWRLLGLYATAVELASFAVLAIGFLILAGSAVTGAGRKARMGPSIWSGQELGEGVKRGKSDIIIGLVVLLAAILLYFSGELLYKLSVIF